LLPVSMELNLLARRTRWSSRFGRGLKGRDQGIRGLLRHWHWQ
jgi:hypothetical protein